MKRIFIVLLFFTVLFACTNNEKFTVEGIVENAQGKTIILEHLGIANITMLDSMKIPKTGKFSFSANRPDYPDFYRIRIQNRSITFIVDSTEIITIHTDFDNFATDYTIQNSPQSELIKNLRISVINIQNQLSALNQLTDQNERTAKITEIEQAIETHRETARTLILENSRSATAYFALYQQINGHYIFSPFVADDYRYWAMVATSYNSFMPDSERSRNLYNFVLEALKEQRLVQQQTALNQLIEQEGKNYIDIILSDKLGVERSLSDLKGKVILIDFSAHEMGQSTEYIFALRDLYTKYNSRGFEIFQISLDRNRLLWEISTENIPWISVRDENGHFAQMYNVRQIPTIFLLDKKGNIVARDLSFSELDREINRLLR